VETVKTCAVPHPETKGSLDSPIAEFKSLKAERQRRIPVVTVRREKALDFCGCNSRPGTGSLHPVAIEAAAEATKLSELSM
jgi:hypothetical protein